MKIDEVIQQPGQPERMLKNDVLRSLHVAVPGEVVSYNSSNRTVVVQPVIREWDSTETPPLLTDVPVFFIGNYTFTPQPGDGCLVIFADHCIDSWLQSGGGVSSPSVCRSHSMSDGFAFIGFNQTGGTPMGGGGGGGGGGYVKTYTVTNASGSYSHTFEDVNVVDTMKAVYIEASNKTVFGSDIDVTPSTGSVKIECANVSGTSDLTITFIGAPESLSPTQYELIMDKIGCLSVVDGKLCITYEGGA